MAFPAKPVSRIDLVEGYYADDDGPAHGRERWGSGRGKEEKRG